MSELDLTGEGWENKFIPSVLGGLVLNQNSESMKNSQFLSLKGMRYEDGDMIKDTGYKVFSDTPNGGVEIFRKIIKHKTAGGTTNTFAVSNTSFYILGNSGDNWHLVSDGLATTTDANVLQNDSFVPVTSTTGFNVGDVVGIELDDGSYHVTTIASINAGVSLALDDDFPAAPTIVATSPANVRRGVNLSGVSDKQVFALTIPWNDALVFTNGVDIVQYYDPSTGFVQDVPNLPSSGDTICESLALFDTSLILIRTTEGGSNFNQRLRWCDKADFTEWVSGDAGFVDLLDSEDRLQQALLIGPYLAIYREKSIYRGTAVNTTTKRFQWDSMVTREGVMSPGGAIDIGDRHFVLGNRQTYIYTGGFDIQPVGTEVKKLLYGSSAELDKGNVVRAFCIYIEDKNDIFIFYQTTEGTEPNKTLRYSLDFNSWATREFNDQMVGFGESTESNSITWDDLVDAWEDQTWTWTSTSISGDSNTILLCADGGQVYEYDFLVADDNVTAQAYEVETPDFSHQNGVLRTDYIEFKISGSNILVEISINEGASWESIETISPGSVPTKVRVFKQVSSRTVRYRLSGSSSFRLSWMNLRITLETEN